MSPAPASWQVRPISCMELDEVLAIAATGFAVPWSRQDFAYFLAHEYGLCLGVESLGSLGGYFLGLVSGDELDVVSIAVHRDYRRQGLGERLLREAMGRSGVRRVFLEVAVENEPAVALYRKLGFSVIGRRPKYYQGRSDALTMRWESPR